MICLQNSNINDIFFFSEREREREKKRERKKERRVKKKKRAEKDRRTDTHREKEFLLVGVDFFTALLFFYTYCLLLLMLMINKVLSRIFDERRFLVL